ncbi:MAG: CocE/NonD family hydrolase [Spirochaetales bacterium]|nr:CocE/NonD family hydrolase [Spirochaetales bacterium]
MFLWQDARWFAAQTVEKISGWLTMPFLKIGDDREVRVRNTRRQKDVWIPMRDGVRLCADLYLPAGGAPTETILLRMPYGKREAYCWMPVIGRFWARRGYACVIQDVRGRFASEGDFVPFVNEGRDGYDTVDCIARQPWSNGRVGIMGESYYGYTCWAAAAEKHPALKCAAPSTTSMDLYANWAYNSGAFCLQTMGGWSITMDSRTYTNELRLDLRGLPLGCIDARAGTPSRIYQEWMDHPCRDAYWEERNLSAERIDLPCLHIGGWYDVFLRSTYEDWARMRKKAPSAETQDRQWLFLGPGDHEFSTDFRPRAGRMDLGPAAAQRRWAVLTRFFDCFLKGLDNGFDRRPRVSYFVMGANQWRSADSWPPPGVRMRSWYLASGGRAGVDPSDGRLLREVQGEGAAGKATPGDHAAGQANAGATEDCFRYDPADPVCGSEGINLWHLAEHLRDRSPVEARPDVLTFTSPVLERDFTVAGPIRVILFASTDRLDTDFTAALVDVYPDGYAQLIQEGILRGGYHNGDRVTQPLVPGRVYRFEIDLWATACLFPKGHALRLEVSSSNFSRFDRNLNTGAPAARDDEMLVAHERVYHSAEYPSALVLPELPA